MCTVAFLPQPGGGYLLGHNRDESRLRGRGLPPARGRRAGRRFLAPRDPDAGGTWIGVNDAGVTLCVLNAADSDPRRLPEVPRSRGLLLRSLLHLADPAAVAASLGDPAARLREVRAFHLVVAVPGAGTSGDARVTRFRWDGARLVADHHRGPALFVSSGYDPSGAERQRGLQWRRFLERPTTPGDTPRLEERLAAWLASHEPEKGALSVCMHRKEAASVSRTLVRVGFGGAGAGGGGGRAKKEGGRGRGGPELEILLRYHDGPPCEAGPERVRLIHGGAKSVVS